MNRTLLKYITIVFSIFCLELIPFNLDAKEFTHCGRIIIDGYFEDWAVVPSIEDVANDSKGKTDLLEVKLSQDDNYFFLYLKFSSEFNFQENNGIQLYVDSDDNLSTGDYFAGLGADLIWKFGERTGNLIFSPNVYQIKHSVIELCALPSVTSSEFEFAVSKFSKYNNKSIFSTEKVKLAISTDLDGDIFPDAAIDNVTFLFAQCDQIPMIPIEIEKESNRFIRVTSWNCLQDNIANSSLTNIFQRILKVINPDIIAFQELYDTDEKFVKSTLQTALPGSDWYVLKQAFTDIVLASRYPIESSHQINGNSAFIVNLGGNTQLRSLIINTHLPASQDNDKRLGEIKNIINFVRNAKTNPVQYNLKKDFPVFIVGDMNLVGYSEQLKLLMTGSIDGNIKDIDWDNSEFNEANPRATEIPFCYTWTKSFSSFWPGKLDYIIFSDFSAELKKSFSINTNKMSNQNIQKYNLNSDDSHKATDHLPIVADFEIKNWNDIKEYHSNFLIFNSFSRLLENNSYISYIIEIYNLLGMKILESDIQPYSQVNLQFLPKGVFYITARTENYNSKPIIIRVCNLE